MDYTVRQLNEATENLVKEYVCLKHFSQVLARLIIRTLTSKTIENIKSKDVFQLKVSDFGSDLDSWLDKGLTFDEIINLISREISSL